MRVLFFDLSLCKLRPQTTLMEQPTRMNKTQLIAILMILAIFLGILSGACESPAPTEEVTPPVTTEQAAPAQIPTEPAKLAAGDSPTPPAPVVPAETAPAAPTEEETAPAEAPTEAPTEAPAPTEAEPTEAPAE